MIEKIIKKSIEKWKSYTFLLFPAMEFSIQYVRAVLYFHRSLQHVRTVLCHLSFWYSISVKFKFPQKHRKFKNFEFFFLLLIHFFDYFEVWISFFLSTLIWFLFYFALPCVDYFSFLFFCISSFFYEDEKNLESLIRSAIGMRTDRTYVNDKYSTVYELHLI